MARKGRHGPTMDRMGARTTGAPETNPVVGAAIMDVVDTQLRDGTPPETRHTLDRLLADGHTETEARPNHSDVDLFSGYTDKVGTDTGRRWRDG